MNISNINYDNFKTFIKNESELIDALRLFDSSLESLTPKDVSEYNSLGSVIGHYFNSNNVDYITLPKDVHYWSEYFKHSFNVWI